jgi:hypothetical protein
MRPGSGPPDSGAGGGRRGCRLLIPVGPLTCGARVEGNHMGGRRSRADGAEQRTGPGSHIGSHAPAVSPRNRTRAAAGGRSPGAGLGAQRLHLLVAVFRTPGQDRLFGPAGRRARGELL